MLKVLLKFIIEESNQWLENDALDCTNKEVFLSGPVVQIWTCPADNIFTVPNTFLFELYVIFYQFSYTI